MRVRKALQSYVKLLYSVCVCVCVGNYTLGRDNNIPQRAESMQGFILTPSLLALTGTVVNPCYICCHSVVIIALLNTCKLQFSIFPQY